MSALINASDDGIVVVHGAQWGAPAHVMIMSAQVHRLSVDHSERHSALLEAARRAAYSMFGWSDWTRATT